MTDTPEVNIPLLRKAVEWAEDEAKKPAIDRQWVQDDFISRPNGRALTLVYSEGRYLPSQARHLAAVVAPHCQTAYCIAGYVAQLQDERYATADTVGETSVGEFAKLELGLTEYQADMLFCGDNTIAEVRSIATEIAGEEL